MATIATLLSGGECVGVGAREAGLTHLWGFEIENDIAQVARDNGFNVTTADVMQLDPAALEVPDVLHASPVCKRASGANQSAELNEDGTKEAPEDTEMGAKIASFIDVMTPRIVTIENVYAYRKFKAFKIICNALERGGYMWDFDNLNSADYGVSQTRRRLILRAKRGALLPNLPQPERWVGWYSAILDLIPTLPDSQFAKWQLERLPDEIKQALLVDSAGYPDETGARVAVTRGIIEPANTIVANHERRPMRAFIVGTNANDTSKAKIYQTADDPVQVIRTPGDGRELRAFLVGGGNTQLAQVDSKARNESEPSFTVFAGDNHRSRAWLSQGRVVSMTPIALARFQSIPDSYILPESKKLACAIIGNAVPPLMYQKIIKQLI